MTKRTPGNPESHRMRRHATAHKSAVAEQAALEVPFASPVMSDMPNHWKWITLRSVCAGIYDCPHTTPELCDTGPFLARSQDIRGGIFRIDQAAHVSESTYHCRIARAEPAFGDILFSREGTYFGIAAEVPPGIRLCLGQRMVLLRPSKAVVNARFLRYWLNSPIMGEFNRGFYDGSVAQRLNLSTIRSLPVPVPSSIEQDAIAKLLGTLDDRIDLNRRMNETLESLARELFKSWFVDFDPVIAKAAGKQPTGMPARTAALFPNSFTDSEIGPIPRQWRPGTYGEIAKNERRGASADQLAPEEPYIALEHMPRRQLSLESWSSANGVMSQKFRFRRFEILFGKLRPYFHKVGVAPIDGVCSTDILVIAPLSPDWFGVALGHASSDEMIQHADAGATGTKMPRTNWEDLARYKIAVPPTAVAAAFSAIAISFVERIIANIHGTHALATLRDALLPRLMSGELQVRHAEKLVEQAV